MSYPLIEKLNPATCISGQMRRMNLITANIFRKYLQPFGVTDSQLTILFVLAKKQELSQKQLCQITLLEKSSLSRNLNRLLEKGYISKSPKVTIRPKGKAFVNTIIPEWEKAMAEIQQLLEEDGLAALAQLKAKLIP